MNEKPKIVGTCQQMCPRSELYQHNAGLINPFECDLNGNFSVDYCIKAYHRSDAGKEIVNSDVRPVPVLIKTLNHIIEYVIGQKMNTSNDTSEIKMYQFVRDRLRAIRTDLIAQFSSGPETIHILETSLLFFIWAGTRFYMLDASDFDYKQNMEQITQSFLSLGEQYRIYYQSTQKYFPSEPFFRAMGLITYLNYPGFMPELMKLPNYIISSEFVQNVIKVRKAILTNNFPLYISILKSVPVQMASYIIQRSRIIWSSVTKAHRKTFAKFAFPIQYLTKNLYVPNSILQTFMDAFKANKKPGQGNYAIFDTKSEADDSKLPSIIIPEIFESDSTFCNVTKFITLPKDISEFKCVDFQTVPKKETAQPVIDEKTHQDIETQQSLAVTQTKSTLTANDEFGSQNQRLLSENNDVLDEKTDALDEKENNENEYEKEKNVIEENNIQNNEPISPPEPNLNNETRKTDNMEFIQRLLTPPRSIQPKSNIAKKQVKKESITLSMKDIAAMIPFNSPDISFVSILLRANDESKSANTALARFQKSDTHKSDINQTESGIVLCQKFSNDKKCLYLLITKEETNPCISSILNCNEIPNQSNNRNGNESSNKYSADSDECRCGGGDCCCCGIPIVQFNHKSGFSPILAFNASLRKAIELGITEITPFDVTDLLKKTISLISEHLLSSSWNFASGNSVINILNNCMSSFSQILTEDIFLVHILPFEHHELEKSDILAYANKIKQMKINQINPTQSRQPISGSTWPKYILDRLKFSFPQFVVPLSVKFDEILFINCIIERIGSKEPLEYVYYNCD